MFGLTWSHELRDYIHPGQVIVVKNAEFHYSLYSRVPMTSLQQAAAISQFLKDEEEHAQHQRRKD